MSFIIQPGTGGGGTNIPVADEGTQITAAVSSFNFTGSGVTASAVGSAVTVNVPGGGGGGGLTWAAVQTTGFTAASNNAYPCNTTSAAFTVTLPASPTSGNLVTLTDYAGTWSTNNLTINPNGNKLNGLTDNGVVSTARGSVNLVYVDATQGWISYASNLATTISQLITATGGNEIKIVGSYKYHIFTASGTFTVTSGAGQTFEVMSVGAGAGGGNNIGGAGGAGELDLFTSVTASASAYTVTVGSKGNGSATAAVNGGNGGTSSFALGATVYVSSLGGSGGGSDTTPVSTTGSGGGGSYNNITGGTASGSNTNNGGNGQFLGGTAFGSGGGGGATAVGGNGSGPAVGQAKGGDGGQGYTLTSIDANLTSSNFTSFTGMTVICSGGAGGALATGGNTTLAATPGTGGGAGGRNNGATNIATAGNASSYGSGGGGSGWSGGTPSNATGGNGYDGIIIVRYLI